MSRTRSIASLPCKIVWEIDTTSFQEIMLSSGGFRRETASGFYPWGKVDSPRKRVAEGLCGWRHGNSFPMTQSAQLHRQMRSIPLCPKAVFYVFVFGPIHDSTTLLNPPPPPSKKTQGLGRVGWVRLSLWGVVLVEAVGVRLRILRFCRFLRWCALPFPLPERIHIRSGRACSCHLRRCWGMADL